MITRLRTARGSDLRDIILALVSRIDVAETSITLRLDLDDVDPALGKSALVVVSFPILGVRSGKQLKLIVLPSPDNSDVKRDPALLKLVAQAMALRDRAAQQSAETFKDLAAALGLSREYAADLLRVSYLAPDIIAAIVDGKQPASLTRTRLIKSAGLPLDWAGQRVALGFA